MIISTIKDGFGNQLFMYACGYATAKRIGTKFAIDTTYLSASNFRDYELSNLKIMYDKIFYIRNSYPYIYKVLLRKLLHTIMCVFNIKLVKEKNIYDYDRFLISNNKSCRLLGYWQSEKYFEDYRDEILKMLTPNYITSSSFNKLLCLIKGEESVSVHVRRGDYVALGICLGKEYYRDSIYLITQKIKNPKFFVFSDDIEYAKNLFNDIENIHYVSYDATNSTIEDFLLMKNCKHNIIANSSYSWWGAWANENNDKIVICPKRNKDDDFYPSKWIQI